MEAIIRPIDKKSIVLTKIGKNYKITTVMSEFLNEYEMPYEEHEHLLALDLLGYLHDQVKLAQIYQIGLQDAARSAHQPLDAGNAAIDYSHEGGQVSMPHKRIVMGPKYRHPVVDKIEAVVLRAPVTPDDNNPTESETGRVNDLFLEVWHGRRHPYYYLLNKQGLIRYRSVEDITPSIEPDEKGDLYSVDYRRRLAPKMSVGALSHALHQYVFRPQTNDVRPPFYT